MAKPSSRRRRGRRAPGRWAAMLLAMVTAGGVVGAPGAARAQVPEEGISVWGTSPFGSFSPNGDGQEDLVAVNFCLPAPAEVTAVARSGGPAGAQVAMFAADVAFPEGCAQVSWDGSGDGGDVPDGAYTLELTATGGAGGPSSGTVEVVVDRRAPGTLVGPAPGATLAGDASFAFAPTEGFTVAAVRFVLGGAHPCETPPGSVPGGDGVIRVTFDTAACGAGPRDLRARVQFNDALGGWHSWETPPVLVTLDNPAVVAPPAVVVDVTPSVVSPNGDGMSDAASITFCAADVVDGGDLAVTVRVLDTSGAVVRTLVEGVRAPAQVCSSDWWFGYFEFVEWDGRGDAGAAAPDGPYRVEVRATDAGGEVGTASADVVVDRRVPGRVASPAPDATLSGEQTFVFEPTAGLPILSVQFRLDGTSSCWPPPAYVPDPDGIYRVPFDTTGCGAGSRSLTAFVTYANALGETDYWSSPAIPVTLENPVVVAPPTVVVRAPSPLFSPDGDGFEDVVQVDYCAADVVDGGNLTVGVRVRDEAGAVVRSWAEEVQAPAPACTESWYGYFRSLVWDGARGDGTPAPDGTYTVEVRATDAGGEAAVGTVEVAIDRRDPGTLVEPAANATLSGAEAFAFEPAAGFTVESVEFVLGGPSPCRVPWVLTAGADGRFGTTFDTARCGNGPRQLTAQVQWRDQLGRSHSWTSPAVPVTLDNPPVAAAPVVALSAYPADVFSPNGDGSEDVVSASYCVEDVADGGDLAVRVRVLDDSGAVVQSLVDESRVPAPDCTAAWYGYFSSVEWDGEDDGGGQVAAGTYTIEVRATDPGGEVGVGTVDVLVDRRVPGAIVSPLPDAALSGVTTFAFKPSGDFDVSEVTFQLWTPTAQCGTALAWQPDADGTFRATFDTTTSACAATQQQLIAMVRYVNGSGADDVWPSPPVPVRLATTANRPPEVTVVPTAAQFSPNGDGQEEVADLYWCAADTVDEGLLAVQVRVLDGSGVVVRSLADTSVQPALASSCASWWFPEFRSVAWDGRADGGAPAADGAYTIEVRATDAAGEVGVASADVVIDRRVPGAVVAPEAGAALSGVVDVELAPTAGFNVTRVSFSLRPPGGAPGTECGGAESTQAETDGVFRAWLDTALCGRGPRELVASVHFTDAGGGSHVWTSPRVPVTLTAAGPPEVTASSTSVFSPNGDGWEDQAQVSYCAADSTDGGDLAVAVRVRSAAGEVVRSLVDETRPPATSCSAGNRPSTTWDGLADDGTAAPDGAYEIEVEATDPGGEVGVATADVRVDRRVPGTVVAPEAGAALSGAVPLEFEPAGGGGLTINNVSFTLQGPGGGTCAFASASDPAGDGAFRVDVDTAPCGGGPREVVVGVSYRDAHGARYWQSPVVPVTLANPPGVALGTDGGPLFTPNGDGSEDLLGLRWCATAGTGGGDVAVSLRVLSATGGVLRSLVDEVRAPAPTCADDWWAGYHSSVQWDGRAEDGTPVPDGTYTVELRATGVTGGDTGSRTVEVVVDRRVPAVVLAPAAGATLSGVTNFALAPGEGFTIDAVSLSLAGTDIPVEAGTDGIWRGNYPVGQLPPGGTTLQWLVQWTDEFGGQHWQALSSTVVIDPEGIPLHVEADPGAGTAPLDVDLAITASHPDGAPLQLTVDFGDGSEDHASEITSPYDPVVVPHTYDEPGAYQATMSVDDGAGGRTSATVSILVTEQGGANTAPVADIATAPASGTAPLDVSTTITASDAEGDALTFRVDHGDGSPPVTGALPLAEPVVHRYQAAGTYIVRTAVSDGELTAVRTHRITVALGEPLVAAAGDDRRSIAGDRLRFDASGSRPAAAITGYLWDFDDGSTSTAPAPGHTFDEPGTYEVTLTVRSGAEAAQDTATVVVEPRETTPGLDVTVTSGGALLSGADVTYQGPDGTRISAASDDGGVAHLAGVADGEATVWVWAGGYRPVQRTVVVSGGTGELDVDLVRGEVVAATLTVDRLTREEIEAAGLDPEAPENQTVNGYEVQLGDGGPTATARVYVNRSGYAGCNCPGSVRVGDDNYYPRVHLVEDQPVLQWLVIPARASFLKEFFQVRLVVQNLAPEPFVLEEGTADLMLPAGMSLAPTELPQSPTVDLPDIAAGGQATATWIARGDVAGDYVPSAAYTGVLEPVGKPVRIEAIAASPVKVWGGSALRMVVEADDAGTAGHPFHVRVGIENVADIPVHNAVVDLVPEGKVGFVYQPRQRLDFATTSIPAGETAWADDVILVPAADGVVDTEASFARLVAGDAGGGSVVRTHPAPDPDAVPEVRSHAVGADRSALEWDPVPGAEGYEVYATPDLATDFPAEPLATLDAATTEATVNGEGSSDDVFAVSTILDGTRTMVHSVSEEKVNGAPFFVGSSPADGSWVDLEIDGSGILDSETFTVQAVDPEGDPFQFDWSLEGAFGARSLTGGDEVTCTPDTDAGELTCEVAPRTLGISNMRITARDVNGAWSTLQLYVGGTPYKYVALGDSYSAGEGVDPYFKDGRGAHFDNRCHRSSLAYPTWVERPLSDTPIYEIASDGTGPGARDRGNGRGRNKFGSDSNVRGADGHEWVFWACSGAHTEHVTTKAQGSPDSDDEDMRDLQPQLVARSVDGTADLVTMTIGGNDVEFTKPIGQCARTDCFAGAAGAKLQTDLENLVSSQYQKLLDTYKAVRAETHALLLVPGYPHIFPDSEFERNCFSLDPVPNSDAMGLSGEELDTLRELTDQLNGVIARAAGDAGAVYVDVRDEFDNHEICGSEGAWINPAHLTFNDLDEVGDRLEVLLSDESGHPTYDGQRLGYAAAVNKCLEDMSTCSGEQPPPEGGDVTLLIGPGRTERHSMLVVPGTVWAGIRSLWPGSDVEMTLTSPSGRVIKRSSRDLDVAHRAGPTYESYQIADPEPGEWTVELYGADVAAGGEPVQVDFELLDAARNPIDATPDAAPHAVVETGPTMGPPALDVAFDATASVDTDGTIVEYIWDFGDGTIGSGPTVEHKYARGRYVASVTVVDDAGNRSVSPPVLIVAEDLPPWPNMTPEAVDDEYTAGRDGELAVPAAGVLGNDTDVEGDTLTAALVDEPQRGSVTLSPDGSFVYTPESGFAGEDAFTYRADDGTSESATATVWITVVPNERPVAAGDEYATDEAGTLAVPVPGVLDNDSDADGATLTAAVATEPDHGTLALAPDGSFTYAPEPGFHGVDTFTYRAHDGLSASEPATVRLMVEPSSTTSTTSTTGGSTTTTAGGPTTSTTEVPTTTTEVSTTTTEGPTTSTTGGSTTSTTGSGSTTSTTGAATTSTTGAATTTTIEGGTTTTEGPTTSTGGATTSTPEGSMTSTTTGVGATTSTTGGATTSSTSGPGSPSSSTTAADPGGAGSPTPADPPKGSSLPFTGSNPVSLLVIGTFLAMAGVLLVHLHRRRSL